jgi:hypothetical protein
MVVVIHAIAKAVAIGDYHYFYRASGGNGTVNYPGTAQSLVVAVRSDY